MKLIREYYEFRADDKMLKEYREAEQEGRPIVLSGKIQQANKKNQNGRIYPKRILEDKLGSYVNEFVKAGLALGELDHTNEPVVNLKNTSHVIKEIWWDGDDVCGKVQLLPTPAGDIAKSLVLAGIPLGISSRAVGSVSHNEAQGADVVGEDLNFICFDLVSHPSSQNAYLSLHEVRDFNPSKIVPAKLRLKEHLKAILKK